MKKTGFLIYPHYVKDGKTRKCRVDLYDDNGEYSLITRIDSNKIKHIKENTNKIMLEIKDEKTYNVVATIINDSEQILSLVEKLRTPFFVPKSKRVVLKLEKKC